MTPSPWRVRYYWLHGEKHFELYRLRDPHRPNREWNRIYPSLYMMVRITEILGGTLDHKSLLAMLRARDILNQTLEDYTNEEDCFQRENRL